MSNSDYKVATNRPLPNMASQVYLYLSAVAPPTILLTGPGMPHVLSVDTDGVLFLSQVCKQRFSGILLFWEVNK